ncbi:MAG: antibiotic resistance protein MarC, partial [Bdellovibrionales bacterium]|nr:antibiotic resistance protein MarC [Bdellovibrionales bacterium]
MSFFLLSFTSLFTLINPFGVVPVFISMTSGMDKKIMRKIALRSSLTATLC